MIDLHAHVLPGIDDGPETLENALALLRAMAAQGVRRVVAGAHTLDGRYNATADAVLRAVEQVNGALATEGTDLTVLPGMELYLGFTVVQALKSGRAFGLNRSRWVLVELPAGEYPVYTERALFELMIAGYRPILNHPERNLGIQKRPELMQRLADKGVGAAITAASLIGHMGSKAQSLAQTFIREQWADIVVSDAHNLQYRTPHLPEGLAAARALGKADQSAEAAIIA